MVDCDDAIGGYFELELPPAERMPYAGAACFQSARVAFFALLRAHMPERVWLPRYVCDAMIEPLRTLRIQFDFYSLCRNFEIADDLLPGKKDWIVCVDYFGIYDAPYHSASKRFGGRRIISDHAQAFFSKPTPGLSTLYSPRKFFGVPDGGLLVGGSDAVRVPLGRDARPDNTVHLLKRLTHGAEAGYSDFVAAEKALDAIEPRLMSSLTKRILSGIDLVRVAKRRRENFDFLHSRLGHSNRLEVQRVRDGNAPLCYPMLTSDTDLRGELRKERIYTATYWKDVLRRCEKDSFEADLANNLIALPCDQRYDSTDLEKITDLIARRGC